MTGFLFFVGIGINSVTMLLGCLLAIFSSLITAKLLEYDTDSVNKGFYGFNAALFGIAVFYLLPISVISLSLVVLGGAFSALLMHFMITKTPNIPALTIPFIVSTWMIVLIIDYAGIALANQDAPITLALIDSWSLSDLSQGVFRGVGHIMLQNNWLSGVVFCCALLFSSYKVAGWVILSSLIGLLAAIYLGFSQDKAAMGLYSFNGCLVAIALAKRYPNNYLFILCAIVLSVLLTRAFEMVTLPALTAPFVITTWLMIGLVKFKSTIDKEKISRHHLL